MPSCVPPPFGAQQHCRFDGTARVAAVMVTEQLDRFLVLAAPAADLPRHQRSVSFSTEVAAHSSDSPSSTMAWSVFPPALLFLAGVARKGRVRTHGGAVLTVEADFEDVERGRPSAVGTSTWRSLI
jgi:hypothetical protein